MMSNKIKIALFILTLFLVYTDTSFAAEEKLETIDQAPERGWQVLPLEKMVDVWKHLKPECVILLRVVCMDWNLSIPQVVRSLNLHFKNNISDEKLRCFYNLEHLDLRMNNAITDEAFKSLLKLTSLCLSSNNLISDESVKGCTQLTSLDISCNRNISDETLRKLTNLRELNISFNYRVSHTTLLGLPFLTSVKIDRGDITLNSDICTQLISLGIKVEAREHNFVHPRGI